MGCGRDHRRRGVLVGRSGGTSCPKGEAQLASRSGVPHTAPCGATVHDAFPSFPPNKKKKKDHVGRSQIHDVSVLSNSRIYLDVRLRLRDRDFRRKHNHLDFLAGGFCIPRHANCVTFIPHRWNNSHHSGQRAPRRRCSLYHELCTCIFKRVWCSTQRASHHTGCGHPPTQRDIGVNEDFAGASKTRDLFSMHTLSYPPLDSRD